MELWYFVISAVCAHILEQHYARSGRDTGTESFAKEPKVAPWLVKTKQVTDFSQMLKVLKLLCFKRDNILMAISRSRIETCLTDLLMRL